MLRFLEVGQYAVPVPTGAAALPPLVVISCIAAHIYHAVDRTGAAEHLAAGLIQPASTELCFWLALIHPVDAWIGVDLREAHRNMDPAVAVFATGFQQEDAMAPRFAEP